MSALPVDSRSDSSGRVFNANSSAIASQNGSLDQFQIPQLVPSPLDPNLKNEKTILDSNATSNNTKRVYYYPEEIANSSTKNGPRNLMKISIHEVQGGNLEKEIRNFEDSTSKFNLDQINPEFLQNAGASALSGLSPVYKTITGIFESKTLEETGAKIDEAGTSFKDTRLGKVVQELSNTGPLKTEPPMVQIYLNSPDDLDMKYGIQYSEENLTSTYKLLDLINVVNNGGQLSPQVADILTQFGLNITQAGIEGLTPGFLSSGLGGNLNLPGLINSKARLAPFENKEYLFQRVKRRSFTFSYKFYPKSQKEIEHVGKIIASLKYYAHPERKNQSWYLKTPAVFKIKHYVHDGKDGLHENLFLNRINNCILEDIRVDYTDVGVMSTLKDQTQNAEYGFKSPVGIKLNLTFKELVLLTREDFTRDDEFFTPSSTPTDGKYH